MTEEARRPRLQQDSGMQLPTQLLLLKAGNQSNDVHRCHTGTARMRETRGTTFSAGDLQRWQTLWRSRR